MREALTIVLAAGWLWTGSVSAEQADGSIPAQVLNLQSFKLTLPIGESERPREISQPRLRTFVSPPWFRAVDGAVVFRAHCGGVTTKGSGYPRSELREMAGADGLKKASWSTTRGRHRMFLRQAITHLPKRKPHVVAGQIHDGDDDVIVIRLEERKLFVDHNGADGPVLDADYELGKVFTVLFDVANGRVRIHYNGAERPQDDYAVKAEGCYFKVGCYTQSNLKKGDGTEAYGEVRVREVRITHE